MSYAFDQGRVQGLYPFSVKISKDFSRTQDGFFPGLQILPYALSFPRLQSQFSLKSTYISHNVNSKNFIACLSKVDFQDFPDFPGPIQNLKVSYLGTQHKEPLQDSNLSKLNQESGVPATLQMPISWLKIVQQNLSWKIHYNYALTRHLHLSHCRQVVHHHYFEVYQGQLHSTKMQSHDNNL